MKVFVAYLKLVMIGVCVGAILVGGVAPKSNKLLEKQGQSAVESAFPEVVSADRVTQINAKIIASDNIVLVHDFVGDLKIIYSRPGDGKISYLTIGASDPLASNPDEVKTAMLSGTMRNLFKALLDSQRSFFFVVREIHRAPVVFFRTSKEALGPYVPSFLLTPTILLNGIQHIGSFSMRSNSGYYVLVLKSQLFLAPASPPYDLVVHAFIESFKDSHSDEFISKEVYILTEEGLRAVPSKHQYPPRDSI